ncbi:MAG: tRNA 2-selenouridine(34) synthase MnmH [Bdellovibrionota bacterium]
MRPLPQIDAETLLSRAGGFALLDVRAPVEFGDGHVPGSVNLPLLTNQERHEVGIAYKVEGSAAAVALGHRLVDPHREERVAAWKDFLSRQEFPVLTCFRGGLRSENTQRWLLEAGCGAARVTGGYKALRRVLFRQWEVPLQGFVITGLTGSDKTGFLRRLAHPRALDLERMARHRGSAFGGLFQDGPQPSQQTFENTLALALRRQTGDFIFEDESRLVGRCVIPPPFFERLRQLPRIFLECGDEERAGNIYQEYVAAPLRTRSGPQVMGELITALRTLRNRLGGLEAAEIEGLIRVAFASGEEQAHREWILRLLRDYYDSLYTHAMARHPSEPIFRGDAAACEAWLRENSDLRRLK